MGCHLKKNSTRIFEQIPAIRNSGKKSATDQKRWQISKNDLYRFDP
jgi:hypothetical protein